METGDYLYFLKFSSFLISESVSLFSPSCTPIISFFARSLLNGKVSAAFSHLLHFLSILILVPLFPCIALTAFISPSLNLSSIRWSYTMYTNKCLTGAYGIAPPNPSSCSPLIFLYFLFQLMALSFTWSPKHKLKVIQGSSFSLISICIQTTSLANLIS